MSTIISSLLPQDSDANWVILDTHESTDGIFEHIASVASELGFTRDECRRNVYRRAGVSYVGYWSTLDGINEAIGVRERGYYGGEPEAEAMREALEILR